jgi:hypothetical protein
MQAPEPQRGSVEAEDRRAEVEDRRAEVDDRRAGGRANFEGQD